MAGFSIDIGAGPFRENDPIDSAQRKEKRRTSVSGLVVVDVSVADVGHHFAATGFDHNITRFD